MYDIIQKIIKCIAYNSKEIIDIHSLGELFENYF